MIQITNIGAPNVSLGRHFAAACKEHLLQSASATFSGFPTEMVFGPGGDYKGSAHVMHLPPGAGQKLHLHPGSRYLILCGDAAVVIRHAAVRGGEVEVLTVEKGQLAAIRMPPHAIHAFGCTAEGDEGVGAWSFHEVDEIGGGSAGSGLMEEETVFVE